MLNEKIYKNILSDNRLSYVLKSISALHVVKLHPQYINKDNSLIFLTKKALKLPFSIIQFFFYLTLNFIFVKKNKKIVKKEILIISHLIEKKYLSQRKDFYFGDLEKIFYKKNKTFFKFLINHTSYPSFFYNNSLGLKNKLVAEKILNPFLELKIFFLKIFCIFELINLFQKKFFNLFIFKKLIISLFDSETTFALRIRFQIINIIKKIEPREIILTYEGFSWEKICINGIKTVNEKIKCIGYQHTFLSKYHRGIYNIISKNYNPNTIWSSHKSSYRLLKKKINTDKVKINFIGNLKNILVKKKNVQKNNKNIFLVLPEGSVGDCVELFNFSLKSSFINKDYKYIWRVHPVININKIFRILRINKDKLPKNISISKDSLDKDIKKSKFILYQGSSAVIQGLLNNSYPIYLKSKKKCFDPLINQFKRKNHILNYKDLNRIVMKVNKLRFNKKFLVKEIKFVKKDLLIKPIIKKIS